MSSLSKNIFSRKRKLDESFATEETFSKRLNRSVVDCGKISIDIIRDLEERITGSRIYYNEIAQLLDFARSRNVLELSEAAISALCRIFSRCIAMGELSACGNINEDDVIISQWLKARYCELIDLLLRRLATCGDAGQRSTIMILMHLIREEGCSSSADLLYWKMTFFRLLEILITGKRHTRMRVEFIRKFVNRYDDLKSYTFDASLYGNSFQGLRLDLH